VNLIVSYGITLPKKLKCKICNKKFSRVLTHIKAHNISLEEYYIKFPHEKEKMINQISGENNSFYGKTHSKEVCERTRIRQHFRLKYIWNPNDDPNVRKIKSIKLKEYRKQHPGLFSKDQFQKDMREIHNIKQKEGKQSTGQEQLYEYLSQFKILFEPEMFIKTSKGPRAFLDAGIVTDKFKLDIEYDGHSRHFTKEGVKQDTIRDNALSKDGWSILRLTNKEVFDKEFMEDLMIKIKSLSGGE